MTHFARNGFLTAKGLKETDQRRGAFRAGLAGSESSSYVDKVGSVSALVEVEDDCEYDQNHNELNGTMILQEELFDYGEKVT